MATKNQKLRKKQKLRNNEYYDIQSVFDELYSKATGNQTFNNLMEIITSEQNVLLSYRNIKKNKGSKTRGTNNSTIFDIGEKEPEKLIYYVKNRLANFRPHPVRRVEIDKENGGKRPLGIPTIEDRIIQQCIKQVLEPICEAKFYKHSYGFRPNRSTHHAIARVLALTNRHNFQYVIDIDIKGFFDNVNHAKLLKQIWTLGIRDKNLLSVIAKMLKAEIKGVGIPEKGVPQGGILSPLLSNIVLNELDWWIASQWDTHKSRKKYSCSSALHSALKKSNLKEVYIVRYADDFKLFCKSRNAAQKLFCATQNWLKERLGLEISAEKSKIVNLKRYYSEFLGIKMKLWEKGSKMVVKSQLTKKSIKKCKSKLKESIDRMGEMPNYDNAVKYNATVLGLHNYYNVATHVYCDFRKIAFDVSKSLKCKLKNKTSKSGYKSKAYLKYYRDYGGKEIYVHEVALFPINAVKTKPPLCFSQDICNYTVCGRKKLHDTLQCANLNILRHLMKNPTSNQSTEFNDNRISLYVGQQGKCFVTGQTLETGNMEVHHKKPKSQDGTDKYDNLVIVTVDVHKLIHATQSDTIMKYIKKLASADIDYKRLNKFRVLVGNCEINVNK